MGNSNKSNLRKSQSVPDTQKLPPDAQVLSKEKSLSSQRLDRKPGKQDKAGKKSKHHQEHRPEFQLPPAEAAFLPAFPLRGDLEDLDFEIIEVIAKGAYGNVIKVQREDEKQFYAMKVLDKGQIIQEGAINQCKDEAAIQSMAGEHPFVVRAYEYWQSRRYLYIVLEYIPYGDMFTLWTFHGCFPEALVRLYIAEMAMVIDYLHNSSVIYRDVKMENILFDPKGHIQLTDFGLAKWLQGGDQTRTVCGTLQYMAPEVLSVYPYGHAADWWSVGILMYAMFTGKYPVDGVDTHTRMAQKVFECDYLLPSNISDAAQDVISRILTKSPHKRLSDLNVLQDLYFFQDIVFSDLIDRRINPIDVVPEDFFPMTGSSYAPQLLTAEDQRHFDQFDDSNDTITNVPSSAANSAYDPDRFSNPRHSLQHHHHPPDNSDWQSHQQGYAYHESDDSYFEDERAHDYPSPDSSYYPSSHDHFHPNSQDGSFQPPAYRTRTAPVSSPQGSSQASFSESVSEQRFQHASYTPRRDSSGLSHASERSDVSDGFQRAEGGGLREQTASSGRGDAQSFIDANLLQGQGVAGGGVNGFGNGMDVPGSVGASGPFTNRTVRSQDGDRQTHRLSGNIAAQNHFGAISSSGAEPNGGSLMSYTRVMKPIPLPRGSTNSTSSSGPISPSHIANDASQHRGVDFKVMDGPPTVVLKSPTAATPNRNSSAPSWASQTKLEYKGVEAPPTVTLPSSQSSYKPNGVWTGYQRMEQPTVQLPMSPQSVPPSVGSYKTPQTPTSQLPPPASNFHRTDETMGLPAPSSVSYPGATGGLDPGGFASSSSARGQGHDGPVTRPIKPMPPPKPAPRQTKPIPAPRPVPAARRDLSATGPTFTSEQSRPKLEELRFSAPEERTNRSHSHSATLSSTGESPDPDDDSFRWRLPEGHTPTFI